MTNRTTFSLPRKKKLLRTPPIARVVESEVFDAYGWSTSDVVVWNHPEDLVARPLALSNPTRQLFLFREEFFASRADAEEILPREKGEGHWPAFFGKDEWVLAPYAIDDATDELFAHRLAASSVLELVADSLAGVFWGFHDWMHFHHHGPFTDVPRTELQCDVGAFVWTDVNRELLGLSSDDMRSLYNTVRGFSEVRLGHGGSDQFEGCLRSLAFALS